MAGFFNGTSGLILQLGWGFHILPRNKLIKEYARLLLAHSDTQIAQLLGAQKLKEIQCPPKARTPRLAAVLENARNLYEAGTLSEERFRELEMGCLQPPKVPDYSAQEIKQLRLKYHVSQPVLAGLLNTSLSTVRQWEIGAKHPGGPSLKLLSILEKKGPSVLMA